MSELTPRIHGYEMEWPIIVPGRNEAGDLVGKQLESSRALSLMRQYFGSVPHVRDLQKDGTSNVFLRNGARCYMDIGDHPEYATPEDDSLIGGVANDIASEQIMYAILNQSDQKGNPILNQFSLHKRTIDDEGHTFGAHESYATNTNVKIVPDSLALLGVHLVTRSILTGAGYLDCTGKYWLAQKASVVNTDYSTSSHTTLNPVLSTRDEPLAHKTKFRRVHVTIGDANMSPWATRMKAGTTSLVLRLLEHDVTLPDLRFADSLDKVAREVSDDLRLKQVYKLKDGTGKTAIEVGRTLIAALHDLEKNGIQFPEEEQWVLGEWERFYGLADQGLSKITTRAEWLLKLEALAKHHEKHGNAWDSEAMRRKDRQWDIIGPNSIGQAIRESDKGWSNWMPSETLISERPYTAPKSTRASIRSEFVRAYDRVSNAKASWGALAVGTKTVTLDDPYSNCNQNATQLISRGPHTRAA